jgi:hypothetical protein
MKRMMAQFWSKKTISKTGQIENVYDPQSMLENYWFPIGADGKGSTVESIGGGAQTMGNLEVLNYFVQKLYKSLKVPLSRLNSDTAFSDGEAITREELKFAQEVIKMQVRWAEALKRSFIIHLKLKGRKILENAKKLGIDAIKLPDEKKDLAGKNSFNTMGINQIYQDNFNYKCWEYYDLLVEQVNDGLSIKRTQIEKSISVLEEKKGEFRDDLLKLADQLYLEAKTEERDELLLTAISEKQNLLKEEIKNIDLVIEDYHNEIKELDDNNTCWWDQYELKEEDLDIKFNEPVNFFALRQLQMLSQKVDMYNSIVADPAMSKTYCQKWILDWSDKEILQNRAMSENDAGHRFVLAQIEANGIDWSERLRDEAQGAEADLGGMDIGGGGGGSLPSPGGSDTDLPDFGKLPEKAGLTEPEKPAGETPSTPQEKPTTGNK